MQTGAPSALEDRVRAATLARVFVLGSLNVDTLLFAEREPADEEAVLVRSELRGPGGHAGNCASALVALGCRVDLLASVGADADGDFLLEDLRARGVGTAAVRRSAGLETGRAYIPVFDEHHYMLVSRAANEALTAADVRAALAPGTEAVMIFDPSREAMLEAVRAASAMANRPVLCWTPGGVGSRDPVAAEVVPHCQVVFLNRAEHRHLSGLLPDLGEDEHGPEVVVTLGAGGAMARRGSRRWLAPGRTVESIDPTGAGDAFAAGYLLGLLAGLDVQTRLVFANVAGALAVTARGARGRLATLPEILAGVAGNST